jgi:hypothetical protein
MTYFAQVNERGELKIPDQMMQQIGSERFGITIENGKLVLSPIPRQHQYGMAWRNLTPAERASDLEKWISQLEPNQPTNISDEDLRRENMYEDRI